MKSGQTERKVVDMIKSVSIKVTSIEKLKEEVAQVEQVETMTIAELDAMLAGMTLEELRKFRKWMKKWGLI